MPVEYAEAGIYSKNKASTVTTDVLVSSTAKPLAAMTMLYKQFLFFHEEGFQQPMPSHFSKMIKNANIFFVYPRLTAARMRLSQESFM